MARIVLLAAALALLSACDSSSQPNPQAAENAAADEAREREINAFRERVNALDDPDEVLALLGGRGRFSSEFSIVDERLHALVKPRIEGAQTETELRRLKKYVLNGGTLVVAYINREAELQRQ